MNQASIYSTAKIKKYVTIAMVLFLIAIVYNRMSLLASSEIVPAKIVNCDSQWVKVSTSSSSSGKSRDQVQYTPQALAENGARVSGSVMLPTRALCSQMVGKKVSVLENKLVPEQNRIYSFVQFWALSFMLAFIPLAYLIGLYSVGLTRVFALVTFLVLAYGITDELGILTKYFPEMMTGTKVSPDKAALDRCVFKAMVEENIEHRSQVKRLVCQDEGISDISSIADLTGLEKLFLQGNNLTSLGQLATLSKLKVLSVAGNKNLKSTKGIEFVSQLEEFQSNKSAIEDLTGLGQLSQLKVLGLMSNKISDISELANLENLAEVVLNYNLVSDVSAFAELNNLVNVALTSNNIVDVSAFANKPKLETFTIYSNPVTDISPMYTNTNMKVFGADTNIKCDQLLEIKSILRSDAKVWGADKCIE